MPSKLVDFFIVGAMRSGTSSIRDALASNPYIDMAKGEPKFFNNDRKFAAGIDGFHELFDWNGEYLAHGEKSPQYAVSRKAPQRVHEYNPAAKIIWMFRNPVDRTISHYAHSRYRTEDAIPLGEAIERRDELERQGSTMAYVFRSEYQKQLESWLRYFPRSQQLILVLEDVIADPDQGLATLHEFLGVPLHEAVSFPHTYRPRVKAIAENDPTIESLRPLLWEILAPTVTWMENFLGRALPSWRPGA